MLLGQFQRGLDLGGARFGCDTLPFRTLLVDDDVATLRPEAYRTDEGNEHPEQGDEPAGSDLSVLELPGDAVQLQLSVE